MGLTRALAVALCVSLPLSARAQDRAVRFQIMAVGDTTVNFRAGRDTWVVRATRTIVVDPRRRDALVARLRVLNLTSDGVATAVVTGQTGRITNDHIVIAEEPPRRWYRNAGLWFGAVFGAIVGFGIGKL